MKRGELVRVQRGVYAAAESWRALKPWERYLARVHAVLLSHPFAVFSHESAAVLWRLPIHGDPISVHVVAGVEATSRLNGGVRVHTTRESREIVDLGGILVTSRAATVVDLARARHQALGLAATDAALRADAALTVEQLVAENESRTSSRGRRHARWSIDRASPVPESPLESVSRAVIELLGFEEPELQVTFVTGGVDDRVDFWWPGAAIVGEADGDVKYDGSLGDPLAAVHVAKHRDRRLRHHASAVAHWGWHDAVRVDPVRLSLTQAGLRPILPEATAQLHSLRALLVPPAHRETASARRNSG